MDLSVLVPAYNEEGSIRHVLQDLLLILPKTGLKWEILVIDDKSRDRTCDIVKEFKKVKLLIQPYNKGYGSALKTGAKHAKGSWLMFYDADNQFYAHDMMKFFPYMAQYDLILGARRGQKSLYRAPGKILLTKFAAYLADHRIPDLNCGFRLLKKSLFDRFVSLYPQRFSITSTITMAALRSGYNVKWVSIPWKPRRTGSSGMRVFRDGMKFMLLIVRLTMVFSPLRVFIPLSAILFLLGAGTGLYEVIFLSNIGEFSTLAILSSIFIFLFGLVADQIANLRRDITQ